MTTTLNLKDLRWQATVSTHPETGEQTHSVIDTKTGNHIATIRPSSDAEAIAQLMAAAPKLAHTLDTTYRHHLIPLLEGAKSAERRGAPRAEGEAMVILLVQMLTGLAASTLHAACGPKPPTAANANTPLPLRDLPESWSNPFSH